MPYKNISLSLYIYIYIYIYEPLPNPPYKEFTYCITSSPSGTDLRDVLSVFSYGFPAVGSRKPWCFVICKFQTMYIFNVPSSHITYSTRGVYMLFRSPKTDPKAAGGNYTDPGPSSLVSHRSSIDVPVIVSQFQL